MQVTIAMPDEIGQYLRGNPDAGRQKLAQHFGISEREARLYATISKMIESAGGTPGVIEIDTISECKVEETLSMEKGGSITVRGQTLKAQYDKEGIIKRAIDEAGIDLKSWVITDIKTKKWNTSMKLRTRTGEKPWEYTDNPHQIVNWAVSIAVKPNPQKPYLEAFEAIIKEIIPVEPIRHHKLPKKQMLAAEIGLVDAHIGKLAWHPETLSGSMDLKIATRQVQEACESSLQKISNDGVSQIFLVLGNDYLHIENTAGETTGAKHKLDFDSRLPKIIEEALKCSIRVCDQCLQVAPTKIIWVPGNHDWHASFWLCQALAQRYNGNKHVEFDLGPAERKMILWGRNLIGLAHNAEGGKRAPTVNYMAQYDPWRQHWSQARWTELHVGHLHKREVVTVGGTIIRRLSALCANDFWHVHGLYTDAVPACESFVFHKEDGPYAEYIKNIDYLKEK